MAEKTDWAKLSKKELQEMLRRQEKLLANKKFLQSLPDRGKKVTETVAKLKELIARRKQLEDTMAQFERMTVSRLVQKTQLELLDIDDSDDDISDTRYDGVISPSKGNIDFSISKSTSIDKETDSKPKTTNEISKSERKHSNLNSTGKWNYESSATPPQYKLQKAKPLSLDESSKLLQDQEKKHKELQAQHATLKLKEQGFLGVTDSHRPFQTVQNPLRYRETAQDEYLSDDSQQEENDMRPTDRETDSDDDEENT